MHDRLCCTASRTSVLRSGLHQRALHDLLPTPHRHKVPSIGRLPHRLGRDPIPATGPRLHSLADALRWIQDAHRLRSRHRPHLSQGRQTQIHIANPLCRLQQCGRVLGAHTRAPASQGTRHPPDPVLWRLGLGGPAIIRRLGCQGRKYGKLPLAHCRSVACEGTHTRQSIR